ncbi:hypothetical protein ACS0TY_010845 [Phlomoides rotata]
MKGNGSRLVKQIISMVRSKTDGVKARLMVTAFTLLSKRKKLSDAIDGIFGDASKGTIVLFEKKAAATATTGCSQIGDMGYSVEEFDDDDDDKYPDLRHSLFDEEEEKELAQLLDDPSSSISAIDIVKNGKEKGEKFNLEDEIDEVADLFITKFHKRMRLQKLLSFKRQAAEPWSDP